MEFDVTFPLMKVTKPIRVDAKTRWEAAVIAADKSGLLKQSAPRIYVVAAASVRKVETKTLGRKKWIPKDGL